jgi:hypothetical protein
MRALKLLVIGMGVVIVLATAAIVTIIVHRAGKLGDSVASRDAVIQIPNGFRVAATQIEGDRVLVRLEGREPGTSTDEIRLLVVDLDSSGRHRTLRLTPEIAR